MLNRNQFLALASTTFLGIGLGLLSDFLHQRDFVSQWRQQRQRTASVDLKALTFVLDEQAPENEGDSFEPTKLDEKLQKALDSFANGKISWEIADPNGTAPNRGQGRNEWIPADIQAEWIDEPGGFQSLKVAGFLASKFSPYTNIILQRRFSQLDLDSERPMSWPRLLGWTGVGLCLGFVVLIRLRQRSEFVDWIRDWSNSLSSPKRVDSETLESLRSIGEFDKELTGKIIATSLDVQQLISKIEHSAEQATSVLSTMPIGLFSFTKDLKLAYMNQSGAELLGIDPIAPIGRSMIEIIRQPTIVNLVQSVQTSDVPLDAELELESRKQVLRIRAYLLSSDKNAALDAPTRGILLTIIDETRLRQLENARRDFTANVSHELKTPLSAIKAYAETLLMGAIDDPEANHRFVERINEQANRLDQLIRDLLHLTRLQSQPDRLQLSPTLLTDIIEICVDDHRTIGRPKGITISTQIHDVDCRVVAEHESVRTIINNLLSNAVRYSKPNGSIQVSTEWIGEWIAIKITDDGIGIPPEDLDRIFERFYRVEKARSQDSGGTGLGLAIVKHLVQLLEGKISVSSVLGAGTVFEVRLKRSE